jgi:hypothetical protein
MLHESGSPFRHGLRSHALPPRNHLVINPVGTGQNNTRPQRQRLRRLTTQRQRRELLVLGLAQHQLRLWSSTHRRLVVCKQYTIDPYGIE